MKYLVEYYSESGTSSDNEFIGFFDTREEAEKYVKNFPQGTYQIGENK